VRLGHLTAAEPPQFAKLNQAISEHNNFEAAQRKERRQRHDETEQLRCKVAWTQLGLSLWFRTEPNGTGLVGDVHVARERVVP
jgi:hypothetical protein